LGGQSVRRRSATAQREGEHQGRRDDGQSQQAPPGG
jgi:hypothetical protein